MQDPTAGGGGFNKYAAGRKQYGMGRMMPTMGKVDPVGYRERDAMASMQRNAMLRHLQKAQTGQFASSDFLRFLGR